MIVVEGCDGTGKTTLVNQLLEDLSLFQGTRRTENRDEIQYTTRPDTYSALGDAVAGDGPPRVWDRLGIFSDPIYSRVMNRECHFRHEELMLCTGILKVLSCPIIICHVPLDIAQENSEATHQMGGVNENLPHIHGQYEGLYMSLTDWTNVHRYDYRVEKAYDELLENVLKPYLVRRQARTWR
jgi:hypothetical protein